MSGSIKIGGQFPGGGGGKFGNGISVDDGSTTLTAIGTLTFSGASVAAGATNEADITIAAGLIQHVSTSFVVNSTTLAFQTIAATSLLGNATGAGAAPAGVPIGAGLAINGGSITGLWQDGTVTASGLGIGINANTISTNGVNTLVGTAASTITLTGTPGFTDWVLTMPGTGGGTVGLHAAPSAKRQRFEIDINQGATVVTVAPDSSFVFNSGITGYPTDLPNTTTRMMGISPDGTKVAVVSIIQGSTI